MICDAKWDETPFKKYDLHYTSTYPSQKIKTKQFNSVEGVFQALHEQAVEIGYYRKQTFLKVEIDVDGKPEFIFKCKKRQCRAILQYKLLNGMLVLFNFYNTHNHKYLLYLRKAKSQKIMKFMSSLPAQDSVHYYNNALQNKFNLSRPIARYFSRKIFWSFKEIDILYEKLKERNAKFRKNAESQILVVCSESMRRNYILYGDMVSYDITYKLIKKTRKGKHLGVGFFAGEDNNKRIVMFGLSATQKQTTNNLKTIFTFFYECNDYLTPKTILTDNQPALISAVQALKEEHGYGYSHMLDWYHKMQNLKKRLVRNKNRDILFTLYVRLLKQVSSQVYNDIVKEIVMFSDDSNLLEEFIKDQKKYCISKVDCSFFGFGINSTRSESLNNLVKRAVQNQTSIQNIVFIVFRVEQRLIKNMKVLHRVKKTTLFHIKQKCIYSLSEDLQIKLFDQIFKNYWQSFELTDLKRIDPITYRINYKKYDRDYYFTLCFDLKNQCWRCSCKQIFKSGIPCAHIANIVRKFKGCIAYYINERWLHHKQNPEKQKQSSLKISNCSSRMRKIIPAKFRQSLESQQQS